LCCVVLCCVVLCCVVLCCVVLCCVVLCCVVLCSSHRDYAALPAYILISCISSLFLATIVTLVMAATTDPGTNHGRVLVRVFVSPLSPKRSTHTVCTQAVPVVNTFHHHHTALCVVQASFQDGATHMPNTQAWWVKHTPRLRRLPRHLPLCPPSTLPLAPIMRHRALLPRDLPLCRQPWPPSVPAVTLVLVWVVVRAARSRRVMAMTRAMALAMAMAMAMEMAMAMATASVSRST